MNKREKIAVSKGDYSRASWYAGQHYYRIGLRGMKSRRPINYSSKGAC